MTGSAREVTGAGDLPRQGAFNIRTHQYPQSPPQEPRDKEESRPRTSKLTNKSRSKDIQTVPTVFLIIGCDPQGHIIQSPLYRDILGVITTPRGRVMVGRDQGTLINILAKEHNSPTQRVAQSHMQFRSLCLSAALIPWGSPEVPQSRSSQGPSQVGQAASGLTSQEAHCLLKVPLP